MSSEGIELSSSTFIVTSSANDTIVQMDSTGLCIQRGGLELIDEGKSAWKSQPNLVRIPPQLY